MSNFIVYQGDCNEIIDKFNPKSVDCIFTSPTPPTKNEELYALVQFFSKAKRVISDLGCVWINLKNFSGDNKGTLPFCELFVLAMRQEGWAYLDDLVWHRFPHMRGEAGKPKDTFHFYADVEHLYRFGHDRNVYFNDRLGLHNTSIFACPADVVRKDEFRSGFPEKVVDHCLRVTTKPGDVVLDPFVGTGTTGVVALKLGRNFIGIDRAERPEYIQKVEDRLRKFGFNERILTPPPSV